jgi:hypothetical protein
MSTIKIENKPNLKGQREKTTEEFIKEYSRVVKENKTFSKDVLEFSELMAKHPADVFIVTSFEKGQKCEQIRQGDIYLFRKGEKSEGTLNNVMFDKYVSTISDKKKSESMNLQLGESITGDHKVIPLKGTNVTIYECNIEIPVKSFRGSTFSYPVKLIEADGAFGIFHKEHGNITCPKGTYLACTQLDARSMTRMKD